MKTLTIALLISVLASPLHAEDLPIQEGHPWNLDSYFFSRHIDGIGLVVFGDPRSWSDSEAKAGTGLIGDLRFAEAAHPELLRPVLKALRGKGDGQQGKLSEFTLLARLQNNLDVDESEAQSATYQWVSDGTLGDFWNLDAALLLDLYFPEQMGFMAYDAEKRAVHLRLGYSWDRVASGAALLQTDVREAFFGFSFFPASAMGKATQMRMLQQSPTQFGLSYREDALAGDTQWSVDFNMQPRWDLGFIIGEKNPLNDLMNRKKSEQTKTPEKSGEAINDGEKPAYVHVTPNFTLSSLLDDVTRTGSVDTGDLLVSWGGRIGFGFFDDRLRVSYHLTGLTPLEQTSQTFVYQEARAELVPVKDRPISLTLLYSRGQRAPSFVDEDRVTLSLGVRF